MPIYPHLPASCPCPPSILLPSLPAPPPPHLACPASPSPCLPRLPLTLPAPPPPHLAVLPYHVPVVSHHNRRVPDGVVVCMVPLQDGADEHHVPRACQLPAQRHCLTHLCTLGKLAPVLLTGAERERHGPAEWGEGTGGHAGRGWRG